jgi:hypothetical protein
VDDLYQETLQKRRELDACIRQLRKNGTAYSEAEREYKIKLREVALRLRSQDMPIGMIQLTVYGEPDVAELRFRRDVAKTVYEANKDAINSTKLQLRLIDAQMQREWGNPQADQ